MNVDAGFPASGRTGLGAVIRDAEGRVVSAAAVRVETHWSALIAELKAINLGLLLAKRSGTAKVLLESDCSTAIRIARGDVAYRNGAGMVADEIRNSSLELSRVKFVHVPRKLNTCAHFLATDRGLYDCNWWINCGPMCIKQSVLLDLIQ